MMAQILVYTAVPFSLGRIQAGALTAAVRGCVEVSLNRESLEQSRNDERSSRRKKRMRLDHLTVEEKDHRRKLMNREAAQNARDKFKTRMSALEKKVQQLKRENTMSSSATSSRRDVLLVQNESLKENCKKLENENLELLQVTMESDATGVSNQRKCISSEESAEDTLCITSLPESSDNPVSWTSLEQAWLINTPLLKGQVIQRYFLLVTLMTITELANASFLYLNMETLFKNMMSATILCINKIFSGMIRVTVRQSYLELLAYHCKLSNSPLRYRHLNYHRSWT